MTTLLCLGLGYCARHFIARHGQRFTRIVGTNRTGAPHPGVEVLRFDGGTADPALLAAAGAAYAVLVSAAPGEDGDPFLGALGTTLIAAGRRGAIVYLSTIGVYGDRGGAWVDESARPQASAPRTVRRVETEAGWRTLGELAGRPVAVLRLGGIYGPGRNPLRDVAAGTARCIEREGQAFNRIHVDDIADAIDAALATGHDGTVNVVDDEPSPSCAPVRFAAELLGRPAPEAEPYEEAARTMSAMARSFWADNRRVRNDRLHALLGHGLAHPSYREGLTALFAAGEGRAS
ncbi:NAD-dependent epimerase/dehydratase family protein [Ancylobacter mangrovi]|uniref:NAD-dependent epimerase/dehydratase family protein n=1 Tax=Ancylobacter mangrovi TaxID=2972472 RepID=UPI0021638BBD|nr:NAD-dependent epimerase/dehydratase family protein [Ancylobacter mangrovi]MCS0502334.1 NAD-dependent dehydratase [Ancylobacter mangrovi]